MEILAGRKLRAEVKKQTATVVDTLDRAIWEAQDRVPWMKELQS
jgi:hypothetical protein